jgi:hypothetical protein
VPNKILSDHLEWNITCDFTETSLLNWVIWVIYSRKSSDVKFAFSLRHRTGLNGIILPRLYPVLIGFISISKVTQSNTVTVSPQARSQNCENWLLTSSQTVCLSVCLPVHIVQLGSHWTDFREIWYLSTARKYRENSDFFKIVQE